MTELVDRINLLTVIYPPSKVLDIAKSSDLCERNAKNLHRTVECFSTSEGNELIARLYDQLDKAKRKQAYLTGVYKQLVTSHRGRRTYGEWDREFSQIRGTPTWFGFINRLEDQLEKYHMRDHARRLSHQEFPH